MHITQKFRIEFRDSQWSVLDPDNVNQRIPIDTAVIDITFQGVHAVEGYIVAVHGLDQEISKYLSPASLRDLGVGAQLRRAPFSKTRRGQLTPDGGVEWLYPSKSGK